MHELMDLTGRWWDAWAAVADTGTVPMMIVAQSVRVVEGLVRHQH